jgi:hypothetical protein
VDGGEGRAGLFVGEAEAGQGCWGEVVLEAEAKLGERLADIEAF